MAPSSDLSGLRISRDADVPASRRRPIIIGLVLLAAIAMAAGFALMRDRSVDVRVATVTVRGGASGGGGLTANGYVVARTKASVSSKVAGRLAFLGVQEGDRVAAGAVIARLESAEFDAIARQAAADVLGGEASRIEAEAMVAQAARALQRARALTEQVAPQVIEDAQTAVEVANARLRAAAARVAAAREGQAAAEANLENTRIRAPFAGTVLRKDAEVGEVVAPSVAGGGLTRGAVVTMADLTTLEVEVDVSEAYIGGISRGQTADIVLDAYPAQQFPGHVRQILPTADRQKATVLVRVAIDSQDRRILPEMGARVVFMASTEEPSPGGDVQPRIFIPAAAARTEGNETVAYVVAEGYARRRVIEAGPVSGSEREVRRGVSGGEVVILDPPAELVDGARVRIVQNNANRGSE